MSETQGWRKELHSPPLVNNGYVLVVPPGVLDDTSHAFPLPESLIDLILAALKDQASESKALALLAGEIADLRNSERNLKTQLLNALNSQEQHAWPFPEPESKWTKEQWRQLAILARTSKERLEAQVQQLQAERDEAIRGLAIARYAPVGDNHHNAASCPYCRSWYDAVIDANASLNDTNAALQAENAALRKALAEIRAVYKRPNSSMRLSAKVMDLTAAAALKAASPEVGE